MLDLYQAQILDRSRNPRFKGEAVPTTHRAEGANTSCGDEITWTATIEDGVISELKHQCRSCAVCSASADLLAEQWQGKSLSDVQTWTSEQVLELLGIPLSATRTKCAVLPLETVKLLVEL